jgi:hypothetical protein
VLLIVVAAMVFVAGCAHKPERGQDASQSFVPKIESDGSKRFVFTVVSAQAEKGGKPSGERGDRPPKGERPSRGEGRERGGRGSQSSFVSEDDARARIMPLLKATLLENAYCRNSYIELEFSTMDGKTEIRGECQESASKADKQKWAN